MTEFTKFTEEYIDGDKGIKGLIDSLNKIADKNTVDKIKKEAFIITENENVKEAILYMPEDSRKDIESIIQNNKNLLAGEIRFVDPKIFDKVNLPEKGRRLVRREGGSTQELAYFEAAIEAYNQNADNQQLPKISEEYGKHLEDTAYISKKTLVTPADAQDRYTYYLLNSYLNDKFVPNIEDLNEDEEIQSPEAWGDNEPVCPPSNESELTDDEYNEALYPEKPQEVEIDEELEEIYASLSEENRKKFLALGKEERKKLLAYSEEDREKVLEHLLINPGTNEIYYAASTALKTAEENTKKYGGVTTHVEDSLVEVKTNKEIKKEQKLTGGVIYKVDGVVKTREEFIEFLKKDNNLEVFIENYNKDFIQKYADKAVQKEKGIIGAFKNASTGIQHFFSQNKKVPAIQYDSKEEKNEARERIKSAVREYASQDAKKRDAAGYAFAINGENYVASIDKKDGMVTGDEKVIIYKESGNKLNQIGFNDCIGYADEIERIFKKGEAKLVSSEEFKSYKVSHIKMASKFNQKKKDTEMER